VVEKDFTPTFFRNSPHRPIPDEFVLKTATICFKADGYYVSISAEDSTILEPKPLDKVKSAVGNESHLSFCYVLFDVVLGLYAISCTLVERTVKFG